MAIAHVSPAAERSAWPIADRGQTSTARVRAVGVSWHAVLSFGLLALAVGAAIYGLAADRSPLRRIAPRHNGLSSLPLTAQGSVSAALGADDEAYGVKAFEGDLQASTPAQGLSTHFSRSAVLVTSGTTRVGLRLSAVGYGTSLQALERVSPRARGNRVSYSHPGLSEWYANGPLGLEQGFTLQRPRMGESTRALTLSLSLSGNARALLASDAQSVTLSHSGGPTLRYTGLSVTDAGGRALHSWVQLQRGKVLLRVDSRGARYPLRIDPFIQQGKKLTGGGESGPGSFGGSVALSTDGKTALIAGGGDNANRGAAWVFTRSGATWTQQGGKLAGGGEVGEGDFGQSVALSADGNTALIGGGQDNGALGAAWVFTRSGSTWTQQGEKLTGAGQEGRAEFGNSVALSSDGNTALIGAYLEPDAAAHGAAWVFTRSGVTWTQQGGKLTSGELNQNGELPQSAFGTSVALSADGNTALIGGQEDNHAVGAAWVFRREASIWTQQGEKLTGGNESGDGGFGKSVALSSDGKTALIGGWSDDSYTGAAWVFTRSGVTWTQQSGKLTGGGEVGSLSAPGYFGTSVALSSDGNTALVGGSGDNTNVGAVWAFSRSGSNWTQQGEKLTGAGEEGQGAFGYSVALSDGNTALVGGFGDGGSVGAAWVFDREPVVVTEPASETTSTSAKLNALVNPNGSNITDCHFEYGTTTTYGTSVPCSTLPGSGESPVEVSAQVSGLTTNTTYHFRISATNSRGTRRGTDQSEPHAVIESQGDTPGQVEIISPAGTQIALLRDASVETLEGTPEGSEAIIGGLSFEVRGVSVGASVDVTLKLPTGSAPNKVYKLTNTGYADATSYVTISGDSITLHLTDGGAGDEDGSANGVIVDPVVPIRLPQPPTLAKLKPTKGPVDGGTTVTIAGTHLTGANAVKFGAVSATSFTVNSATSITAVSPAEATGIVDVTVTTPVGTTPLVKTDHFKFFPTVTGLSPSGGSIAGGTSLTVTGSGFALGSSATVFKFGKPKATSVNCTSSTECTVVAPAHAAGAVDVKATVNKLSSPKAAGDQYTYN
jgi:hypothetical protein